MSASERQESDAAERGPDEDEAGPRGEQEEPEGVYEVPLFLRDSSDGPKGNAQDEKDEVGE
jgi:hypothetical protein